MGMVHPKSSKSSDHREDELRPGELYSLSKGYRNFVLSTFPRFYLDYEVAGDSDFTSLHLDDVFMMLKREFLTSRITPYRVTTILCKFGIKVFWVQADKPSYYRFFERYNPPAPEYFSEDITER